MKKYILISLYVFIFLACKSQEEVIEYENDNLIIFDISCSSIKFIDKNDYSIFLLKHKNLIFIKDFKHSDIPYPTGLSFTNGKDTMNIILNYGNWGNVFVKNLEFKKGYYEINRLKKSKLRKLNKDEIPKQKIVSKNVFISGEDKRRDIELKDLLFSELDLKDTVNVEILELKKLMPLYKKILNHEY